MRGCSAFRQVTGCGAPQDPEGLLAAPKGGHIGRRMLNRQAQDNEELKEQMDKAREEARQELSAQREVRCRTWRCAYLPSGGRAGHCECAALSDAVPDCERAPCAEGGTIPCVLSIPESCGNAARTVHMIWRCLPM